MWLGPQRDTQKTAEVLLLSILHPICSSVAVQISFDTSSSSRALYCSNISYMKGRKILGDLKYLIYIYPYINKTYFTFMTYLSYIFLRLQNIPLERKKNITSPLQLFGIFVCYFEDIPSFLRLAW